MPIEYTGDTEWEEQADWSLQINDKGGADTLSRSYRGRGDTLDAFLLTIPKKSQDATYPQLKRQAVNVTGDRTFPTVRVEYRGIFNDDLGDVHRSGGWRRQTVTLVMQATDGGTDLRVDSSTQCTVVYYAPFSTYKYVTRKEPKTQRFAGKLIQTEAAWEIRQVRGAGSVLLYEARPPLWQAGIVTGGIIRPGYFNFVRTAGTSIFTFDEAGDYWEVTEQIEGLIEPIERADLPRLLTSSDVAAAYEEPEEETVDA